MNCPKCDRDQGKVIDSRGSNFIIHGVFGRIEFHTRRRRRTCLMCGFRYTTYEVPEEYFKRHQESERLLDKKQRALKILLDS